MVMMMIMGAMRMAITLVMVTAMILAMRVVLISTMTSILGVRLGMGMALESWGDNDDAVERDIGNRRVSDSG